jgi:hypothetical protein
MATQARNLIRSLARRIRRASWLDIELAPLGFSEAALERGLQCSEPAMRDDAWAEL